MNPSLLIWELGQVSGLCPPRAHTGQRRRQRGGVSPGFVNALGGPSFCLGASPCHSLDIPCVLGAIHVTSHFIIPLQSMLLVTYCFADQETSEKFKTTLAVSSQLVAELRITSGLPSIKPVCILKLPSSPGALPILRFCQSHIVANLVGIHAPMDPVHTFFTIRRYTSSDD